MQKQTFEKIKEMKAQIVRIERLLIGTAAFVIISLLDKVLQIQAFNSSPIT